MKARLIFLFSFVLFVLSTEGFVHQKTIIGNEFVWPDTSAITLYVNGANSSGLSSSNIVTRVNESASLWNNSGGPDLSVASVNTGPKEGRSDIYFSTDPIFFSSSSILAVTESIYNESDGTIIESDIIIKDSVLFSNSQTSSPYIGDVLSHEIGHLLGMDHATLPFSTMFYKLTRGQVTPAYDDHLGKSMLYNSLSSSGKISGKVAGGDSVVGIFASDVQLISSKEGRIIASTLTDENGTFSFDGIPNNDVYYIYVKPLNTKSSLSPFYQTAKKDFCTGFADYKGTFFESCDNSRKGYPQGIELLNGVSSIDVGVITIKCNINVPLDYFPGRDSGEFRIGDADRAGDSFVGYFTESDISSNKEDNLYVDLSHIDASSGNLYLDLNLIAQDFQSRIAYNIEVTSPLGFFNYTYSTDSDFNPNLNLKGRINLDPSVFSNNVFEIRITPTDFDDFIGTTPFSLESLFFPDFATIGDDRYFYQFIYFVSESSGPDYPVVSHYNYPDPRGNSACMEGDKTYGVKPAGAVTGVTSESFKSKKEGEAEIIACGSVALASGSGGGPPSGLSLMIGIMFAFALFGLSVFNSDRTF
jgi:hypothetical protein